MLAAVDLTGHAAASGVGVDVQREGRLEVSVDLGEVADERCTGGEGGGHASVHCLQRGTSEVFPELRFDAAIDRVRRQFVGSGGLDVDASIDGRHIGLAIHAAGHGRAIPFTLVWANTAYTAAYLLVILLAASAVFSSRDLK